MIGITLIKLSVTVSVACVLMLLFAKVVLDDYEPEWYQAIGGLMMMAVPFLCLIGFVLMMWGV